jgi:hypothetical protein
MHDEIRNIQLEESLIIALDNVGPAKAKAVIAVTPTLGELVDIEPANLAAQVRGLSESVASAIVGWANSEWTRLVTAEKAVEDPAAVLAEEEVLASENPADSADSSVGVMHNGLAVTDVAPVRQPKSKAPAQKKDVVVIHLPYDKKTVVRRG